MVFFRTNPDMKRLEGILALGLRTYEPCRAVTPAGVLHFVSQQYSPTSPQDVGSNSGEQHFALVLCLVFMLHLCYDTLHRIALHRIASHWIALHRIASHLCDAYTYTYSGQLAPCHACLRLSPHSVGAWPRQHPVSQTLVLNSNARSNEGVWRGAGVSASWGP